MSCVVALLTIVLLAASLEAQSYTCPEEPSWVAAPCSVHKAFTPTSGAAIPHYLRPASPHENYVWWSMEMFEISNNVELLVWAGHYEDEQKIAELVAASIAVLPPVVLRSLPVNTLVSLDIGSGSGAIYWGLPNERAHAVEFAAAFAHESDNTLDWSFEELLLHEFGHVLDVGLYNIRSNPGWLTATRLDQARNVTEYSSTNAKEAFAETFAVWMAYRRDQARHSHSRRLTSAHETHILNTIRHRGAWLDEQVLQAGLSPNAQLFSALAPGDSQNESCRMSQLSTLRFKSTAPMLSSTLPASSSGALYKCQNPR